ncbi:GntR family transcriptional regulator [Lacrimispora sp. 210928-DFI.3.58]|uniref:GntR family transcriptional regulator n=1 Tax=Lacrimispora sp. 210928-DFI.3.58 TaxID=2883214 RepID=UPI0015B685B2|nr:GntR family transcriptional regulator [Lacrimispora sp. 210928-DFI.3.58]MCB7318237.1 GntR family transcriptional regulator [Lacrimispora sp. 210928-DFI.3.58]
MKSDLSIFRINKAIPVPLYYQLKLCILDLIENHTLNEGDLLPPENELCDSLGISRPTVRQCLGELVSEGYLVRQKGKGTFVAPKRIDARFLNKLQTFNEEMRDRGLVPTCKLLQIEVVNPQNMINESLGLAKTDRLILLKRLRGVDNEPIMIQQNYLSYDKFHKLLEIDFSTASLYHVLEEEYGLYIDYAHRSIQAANATSKEAQLLQINSGMAICIVTTVAYANRTTPVEYTISKYRGDRMNFGVELCR